MQDKFWNSIVKTRKKKWTYYHLILKWEQYPRSLWYLDHNGFFQMKRDPEYHYYNKLNAYGFNYQLINQILDEKTPIVLSLKWTKQKFLLQPNRIRSNEEKRLNFSSEWFELQVFVKWDKIQEQWYWSEVTLKELLIKKDKTFFIDWIDCEAPKWEEYLTAPMKVEIVDNESEEFKSNISKVTKRITKEKELDKSVEIYYLAPSDEIFEELKTLAMDLWMTYDNTYWYADEKISRIINLENIRDNFMYMFAMFDVVNQKKIVSKASPELQTALRVRLWKYRMF